MVVILVLLKISAIALLLSVAFYVTVKATDELDSCLYYYKKRREKDKEENKEPIVSKVVEEADKAEQPEESKDVISPFDVAAAIMNGDIDIDKELKDGKQ